MIQLVDRALEQLFRQLDLMDSSVDISFDAPDKTWGAARVRPTVNVFLWEVVRNPSVQRAMIEQSTDNGVMRRRPANPIVDLHYLVTAWASEQRDEHQILGSLLRVILGNARIPDELLPEQLKGSKCGLGLAPYEKRVPGEFWSALDGQLKPGLQLEVSLPLAVFDWIETAPPADAVVATVGRVPPPAEEEEQDEAVVVRRRSGASVIMEGRRPGPGAS